MWLEYFAQYFVLYSYMSPISLTVTIEVMRMFHSILIHRGPMIVDEEFGHAVCRNSNIICQLRLVSHLLSNKTGTLTENLMELRKFVVDGETVFAESFANSVAADASQVHQQLEMLLAMAICNSVIVFEKSGQPREYKTNSPDEEAFVKYAAQCGVALLARRRRR